MCCKGWKDEACCLHFNSDIYSDGTLIAERDKKQGVQYSYRNKSNMYLNYI